MARTGLITSEVTKESENKRVISGPGMKDGCLMRFSFFFDWNVKGQER